MLRGMLRNKRQSIFPPGWNVGFTKKFEPCFTPPQPTSFTPAPPLKKRKPFPQKTSNLWSVRFTVRRLSKWKNTNFSRSTSRHLPIVSFPVMSQSAVATASRCRRDLYAFLAPFCLFTLRRVNTLKPSFFKSFRSRLLHNVPFMRSKSRLQWTRHVTADDGEHVSQ